MSKISLLITSLIYYFPVIGLWKDILKETIKFDVSMFGVTFRIDIPNSGILLLLFWSIVTWAAITLLLNWVEKIIKIDLLEKLKLRNGLIYSDLPIITVQVVEKLAYVSLTWLVIKYTFLSLFQLLISFGLFNWLGQLLPEIGGNSALRFSKILSSFLSKPMEMAALAFSILIIIVSVYFKKETQRRYLDDIEKRQEIRHRQNHLVIIPNTKIQN